MNKKSKKIMSVFFAFALMVSLSIVAKPTQVEAATIQRWGSGTRDFAVTSNGNWLWIQPTITIKNQGTASAIVRFNNSSVYIPAGTTGRPSTTKFTLPRKGNYNIKISKAGGYGQYLLTISGNCRISRLN